MDLWISYAKESHIADINIKSKFILHLHKSED